MFYLVHLSLFQKWYTYVSAENDAILSVEMCMFVAECHMVSGSTKSNYTVVPQSYLFIFCYFILHMLLQLLAYMSKINLFL